MGTYRSKHACDYCHVSYDWSNTDESRVNASKKTTAEDSGIGEDHALAGEIDLYRTSPTFIPYSNPGTGWQLCVCVCVVWGIVIIHF